MAPPKQPHQAVGKGKENRHRGPVHGREFDRKSGTGRRDGTKKQTVGKGNWGNPLTAEEGEQQVYDFIF